MDVERCSRKSWKGFQESLAVWLVWLLFFFCFASWNSQGRGNQNTAKDTLLDKRYSVTNLVNINNSYLFSSALSCQWGTGMSWDTNDLSESRLYQKDNRIKLIYGEEISQQTTRQYWKPQSNVIPLKQRCTYYSCDNYKCSVWKAALQSGGKNPAYLWAPDFKDGS